MKKWTEEPQVRLDPSGRLVLRTRATKLLLRKRPRSLARRSKGLGTAYSSVFNSIGHESRTSKANSQKRILSLT